MIYPLALSGTGVGFTKVIQNTVSKAQHMPKYKHKCIKKQPATYSCPHAVGCALGDAVSKACGAGVEVHQGGQGVGHPDVPVGFKAHPHKDMLTGALSQNPVLYTNTSLCTAIAATPCCKVKSDGQ